MKAKKISIFILTVFAIIFTVGCSSTRLNDSYPQDLTVSDKSNYPVFNLNPDWPMYHSVGEIVAASTNIYSGRVTDISFDIIDYKNGLFDNDPDSDSKNRMIYTVYTVKVNENYKGESPSEIKVCRIGGISGYKEDEQFELLKNSRLISEECVGIYISDNGCSLVVGEEYLFCTSKAKGGFDFIINPYQFAHHIDSENAKGIIGFLR